MRIVLRIIPTVLLALAMLIPVAKISTGITSADMAPPDEVSSSVLTNSNPHTTTINPASRGNGQGHAAQGVTGLDTISNTNGHFHILGYNNDGNLQSDWYTNQVGHMPGDGGTTTINAPIIPVALDLRNADGTPRYVNGQRLYYDPSQYVAPTVNSPLFQPTSWPHSSTPTQFDDAIQRAEYNRQMAPSWHTLLAPNVKTERVMTLIKGTYQFALNADGTCCRFVLVDYNTFVNQLFPPTYPVDNTTVIGAAELAGEMTTKDISTMLFPNTFLYFNSPSNCCVLGFHAFDYEPGDASNGNKTRAYIMNYSSWISPGLFGGGLSDVSVLSHELSETFNDPFVQFDNIHDGTPWWLAPNGVCQNNLETGDVIENLPNGIYPVTLNGTTYHVQNEALLQWFEGVKSDALDGAYSYPNESVLTSPMVAQKPFCAP